MLSHVQLFATPWTAARQASLSITNSQSLLKLMSIRSMMPSSNLIFCHPLLLLPSIFPSIRVFSNESVLSIRWPKCWSFSFSISPSNEYSGFISFRIDWFDLPAVQETLTSLLQHSSSKASILQCSAFFIVQGTLKSLLQHHSSKASILQHSVFFMVQNVVTSYHFNCSVQQQQQKIMRYEKKLKICPICRKKERIEILSEEVQILGLQNK